ncbi:MAG TPA: PH domain-containing protein [Candidatus Polarisedimenticolaceae bacterium]
MPSELRLHPSSLIFGLGSVAWRLLIPALFVFVLARGDRYEAIFAFVIAPMAAAGAVFRYVTFRYRFDEKDLVVRRGLLFRNERHIPYARIQNVDLVQNVLHRLFGVAEVRVQTASGGEAEATFRVLSIEAVDAMRAQIARERAPETTSDAPASPEEPEARVLAGMPLRERILFGVISNRGTVVVAALFGLATQYLWRPEEAERLPFDPRSIADSISESILSPGGILLGVLALLGLIVALRMLSIAHALLTFHGFELRLAGEDLRTTAGLFTRVSATVPRHRIQIVSIRETPLHRLFGRASVQVESAGGGAAERDENGGGRRRQDWLVPLMAAGEVADLVKTIEPDLDLAALEWKQPHPSARRRLVVRRGFTGLVFGGTLAGLAGFAPGGLIAGGMILAAFLAGGWLQARSLRWAEGAECVAFRSGWWTRRTSATRFAKVQAVSLVESPFDRRHGTATVGVDTAGGLRLDHRVRIPFLPAGLARELTQRWAMRAEAAEFRW